MTLQYLSPELLAQLELDDLRDISLGHASIELLEFKGDGLNMMRKQRDEKRAAGENTVRLDAEIEYAERMTAGPIFYINRQAAAA
ncbi:hypothetical protein CcrColossus_gp073 [Caulobacter phage CcrColossus]|uniref:Uncharacterized protein n=1 Tax=Caulobacter phage CcrColossus TaxID=1211640 RepID=K4JVR5_9CAUD|nr:hypothetical protein CcrColossus_gp073 [Caulobacter phage CcrColossus]AFU87943.1 hypothetical protein CcrColossus_gp073 [Caulobacter phage CcrColossus]